MRIVGEAAVLCGLILVGQADLPDWTHLASLPFAFAVGAFLVWSMVQLLNLVLKNAASKDADTLSALREQIKALRDFQERTLVELVTEAAKAMQSEAEAAKAAAVAWQQVHTDFRDLIGEMKSDCPRFRDRHHEKADDSGGR